MKASPYTLYVRDNKTYTKPCLGMSKIDFTHTVDPSWKREMYFGTAIVYPVQLKIISQSQAVDFHSLVGNIGGYIGLFLGTNIMNVSKNYGH